MGTYKEIKGDLLDLAKKGEFNVIAHGCNCFKVMGAGIALQIARQFPEAQYVDNASSRSKLQRLGDFSTTNALNYDFNIVNLYTQYEPGPNLNYPALELSLYKLSMLLKDDKSVKIGLPQIGCGIAGGNWEKVKEIIQRVLSDFDVTVVIYGE